MKKINFQTVDVQGLTAMKIEEMIETAKANASLNHPMLSENELNALFDVHNGLMLWKAIPLNLSLAVHMSDADEEGEISQKWRVDVQALYEKLINMGEDDIIEVVKRIGSFWLDYSDYLEIVETIAESGCYLFMDCKMFYGIDYTVLKYLLINNGVETDVLYELENNQYPILSLTEVIDDSE